MTKQKQRGGVLPAYKRKNLSAESRKGIFAGIFAP